MAAGDPLRVKAKRFAPTGGKAFPDFADQSSESRLPLIPLLGEAIIAIDRTSGSWDERHLGLLTAGGASYLRSLAWCSAGGAGAVLPPTLATLRAPARLVLKAARLEEFLLADCEHKFRSTVSAYQSLVRKRHHQTSLTDTT